MKNPCPCPKKQKRKTTKPNKKVSVPAGSYNKFAGIRAPISANTSGTFTMPGFAPIQAFPYPGLKVGNASQMYGLLTGSHLADLAAANIYRVQDRRDDVASGIGVTGLNGASKGNVTARKVNMTNRKESILPNTTIFESFSDDSFMSPRKSTPRRYSDPSLQTSSMFSPVKQEQIEQSSMKQAIFNTQNDFVGDSQTNPIKVTGIGAPMYTRSRTRNFNSRLGSPLPLTGRNQN